VQRREIRDQLGALGVVLQASIDHQRARHHRPQIGEVFFEGRGVPGDAELLVVGGVVEACNAAGLTTDQFAIGGRWLVDFLPVVVVVCRPGKTSGCCGSATLWPGLWTFPLPAICSSRLAAKLDD